MTTEREAPQDGIERAREFFRDGSRRDMMKHGNDICPEKAAAFAASEVSRVQQWKEVVIDACVVNCIGWDENDPRKTLSDLIGWEVQIALDPKVSKEAQELVSRVRRETLALLQAHEWSKYFESDVEATGPCPICRQVKSYGHKADCWYAAAIWKLMNEAR